MKFRNYYEGIFGLNDKVKKMMMRKLPSGLWDTLVLFGHRAFVKLREVAFVDPMMLRSAIKKKFTQRKES